MSSSMLMKLAPEILAESFLHRHHPCSTSVPMRNGSALPSQVASASQRHTNNKPKTMFSIPPATAESRLSEPNDPQALSRVSSRMTSQYQEPFISALESASSITSQDDPNYYSRSPQSLITISNIHTFTTGTGSSLYNSLVPLLESTENELLLVTCFWASSSTRDTLNAVLRKLSDKAVRRGTEKIRVRICFSSSSMFQKLFHKQSVGVACEAMEVDWLALVSASAVDSVMASVGSTLRSGMSERRSQNVW